MKHARPAVALVMEFAGIVAIILGVNMWSPAAARIVAGVFLILEAFVVERR